MAGSTSGKAPYESPTIITTPIPALELRPFIPGERDWRLMARWLSDPRVLEWYEGRDNPFDEARAATKWSTDAIAEESLDCRVIEYEGEPIGYLQFYPVDDAAGYELASASGAWGVDLFIGETGYWERGLGTAVVRGVVAHLLANGAKRIVIDPRTVNHRAIRAYEKAGFRKLKVLTAHEMHEGEMRDCWLMEIVAG
jgi:aminoglycoside 6'-N-acetyltransferase